VYRVGVYPGVYRVGYIPRCVQGGYIPGGATRLGIPGGATRLGIPGGVHWAGSIGCTLGREHRVYTGQGGGYASHGGMPPRVGKPPR